MINNTTVTQSYTTTGLEETIYPVTFRFYSDINGVPKIVVQIKTASATEYTTLQYAGDYTLQDVEAGGQGILLVNEELFVSGSSLRITRTTPLTQDIDFQVGRIDPEQIELSADLSAMRDQEIRALVDAANTTADEALEKAEDAVDTANEAEETAGQAKTIAEGIEAKADEALEDSAEALETANEAKETAEAAEEAVAGKQDQIVAGANITIAADGKTISATDTVYTAGSNITIVDNTISATYTAGNGLTLTGGQFSANVQNVTSSTSTTDALSANMGREMQLEISHLQSIGRFLSFWNCATGLPTTSPQTSPYTFKSGDWFRVGEIATGGASNYKPNGSTYTTGVASTTVETGTVVVGQVYYYDGTNWSLSAGGGSVEVDNQTITFNTDNQIQASGVIETNDNAVTKIWTGESADLPATRDSNTLYNVTDDIGGSATQIGAITEALNGKQDLLTGTATGGDYVIEYQVPTSANNYTWYRKYKSGWVEQGGQVNWNVSCSNNFDVTYPITMLYPTNSLFVSRCKPIGDTGAYDNDGIASQTTTGFHTAGFSAGNAATNGIVWQVSGMAA